MDNHNVVNIFYSFNETREFMRDDIFLQLIQPRQWMFNRIEYKHVPYQFFMDISGTC